MIIPNIKNLIKDDFSDFTPYQGAVVTRNKTFPIDVFKGGRNLLLDSGETTIINPATMAYRDMGTPIELQPNVDYVFSWNIDWLEETTLPLLMSIGLSSDGIRYHWDFPEMGSIIVNKNETQFRTIRITQTQYDDGLKYFAYRLRNRNQLMTIELNTRKFEKGNIATEYSPAPEDGYGLDLPNGAYHIQTSGGSTVIKLLALNQKLELGKKRMWEVTTHAFLPLRISNNISVSQGMPINATSTYQKTAVGNGVSFAGFQLRAITIDDPLDFIASDPSIIDEQSINTKNVIDIVQLPEISREEKQITILSTDEVIIDDFISFNMSTKGSLYQRNMKYCEVVLSGKYELTSKWINIKRFVASDLVDNGNLQEIDYGDFGVLKSEYDDTTQRTKLTCYDRMLQAQIPYDSEVMNLTYPMTISQVLNRLAIVCKLDLVVNTVNNLYQVIHSDLWANQSFTYADVLDHIAQATTSIISIRNNKLEIFNPIENDFTIQGKFYSLKIGESYGKTNIVNVSQEPQHYNKFAPSNALDIPLEDRKELAFSNNPILNQDMQTWADRLYLQTKDLEYATFESSTIGYGIFEVGDMVNVYEAGEDVIHRVMITNETFDFKHALTTEIGSSLPMVHKNQYVVETDQARQGQTTYLIVDQLNGVIEALVQSYDDLNDKTAQLRIDVDSIELQVENIGNGNILPNGSGEMGYYGYIGGSDLVHTDDLVYQDYMTYSHGFIPKKMLGSLSEWGLSFINSGYDITPSAYVVPDTPYSYKAKVNRFKPFSIDVLEFNDLNRANALTTDKVTNFAFNNTMDYVQFTFTPNTTTQFVRLKYNRTGVTYLDRLEITEVMLNRGVPREWQQSPTNAMIYSQTTRTQLSDRIDDVVSTVEVIDGQVFINKTNITQLGNEIELKVNVDGVISAINLTSEQAKILANHISLEGLTTINGNFKVLPNGDVEFINAKGTNVNLSGQINSTLR